MSLTATEQVLCHLHLARSALNLLMAGKVACRLEGTEERKEPWGTMDLATEGYAHSKKIYARRKSELTDDEDEHLLQEFKNFEELMAQAEIKIEEK